MISLFILIFELIVHTSNSGLSDKDSRLVFVSKLLDVSKREDGVVALHLPIRPLKTRERDVAPW